MKISNFVPLIIITTISLMAVVLYNGFPLTEGETGAYIEQAIYPHFSADRTPFYGLFVRVTSLWTSLWFPVVVQCAILAYLVLKYIAYFQPDKFIPASDSNGERLSGFSFTLLTVISIISFTCVSWVTAYLMPDVFAGILLLAVILYITEKLARASALIPYLLIIFVATLMHNSHFLILVLFSIILLVWSLMRKNKVVTQRSAMLIGVCVVVWVIMCSMNAIKKHGFVFSRGKDVMLMAKFSESGILGKYLDENCDKQHYKICVYKNNLPPDINEFLWSGESPLFKMGGWDSSKEEYRMIVHDILTTPRYSSMFAEKSVISTLKELTQIQAPDRVSWEGKDTEPWKKVRQYFADELREYVTSLQNTHALSAGACNIVYYLFFALSTIWLLLFYPRIMNRELHFIYCCILLFFVINAFVTSTFSVIIYSFQNRVFWILPATNAIIIIQYYKARYLDTKEQNSENG